jgi:hypothetical protein
LIDRSLSAHRSCSRSQRNDQRNPGFRSTRQKRKCHGSNGAFRTSSCANRRFTAYQDDQRRNTPT